MLKPSPRAQGNVRTLRGEDALFVDDVVLASEVDELGRFLGMARPAGFEREGRPEGMAVEEREVLVAARARGRRAAEHADRPLLLLVVRRGKREAESPFPLRRAGSDPFGGEPGAPQTDQD